MLALEIFNSFELKEVRDMNVLAIEQDQDYQDILKALLKEDSFKLDCAKSAQDGLKLIKNGDYGLIFLNTALNNYGSANKLIDEIRNITLVPVIALVEPPDEADGSALMLDGADYDLQKPFTPRRLRAAVTAVLRRSEIGGAETSEPIKPETITGGGLELSLGRLEATVNNKKISLSAREFSLLQFLMSNPNRTFTREELAAQAWGWAKGGEIRAVDSAIKRLRNKIEDDSRKPRFILTERSLGYRFNASSEATGGSAK